MMLSTHLLIGGVLGLWPLFFMPEFLTVSVLAGIVMSAFPDLDLFHHHRRSLHRPFQYLILTAAAAVALILNPYLYTVVLFSSLAGMTAHSLCEILSSGMTMRPEEEPDDRAVYDHIRDRWIAPRRYILFGESKDLILTVIAGTILLNVFSGFMKLVLSGVIVFGIIHFLVLDVAEKIVSDEHSTFSEYLQKKLGLGPMADSA